MSILAETTQETEAHLVCWWLYPVINVQHAGCTRCFPGNVPSSEAHQWTSTLPAPEGHFISKFWRISLIQKTCAAYA